MRAEKTGARSQEPGGRDRAVRAFSTGFWLLAPGFLIISSCTQPAQHPTTQPAGIYDRSEEALKDPFGYSPNIGKSDISGGGIGELDEDAMRKDLDHVLDP